MIALFGFSWPNNIMTTLKNKSTKGKSLAFLLLIDTGYVCGIVAKFMKDIDGWFGWLSVAVYILNFVMVSTDLILYFYYRSKDKKANQLLLINYASPICIYIQIYLVAHLKLLRWSLICHFARLRVLNF